MLHLLYVSLAISQDIWLGITDLERDSLMVRGAGDEAEDGILEEDPVEVVVAEAMQYLDQIRLSRGLKLMRQGPAWVRPGYILSLSKMPRYPT